MPEEQRIAVPTEFDPEDEYRPEPEPEPLPPSWMDGRVRIGIHTSIAGSYLNALESARKLGCNALQIFSASPRMWQGGPARVPELDAAAFRARREELRQFYITDSLSHRQETDPTQAPKKFPNIQI